MTLATILLLFVGALLAATVSGAAGFGGALLLLPWLTRLVGVAEAVPLLTAAQLVGNLTRAALGARQIDWRAVGAFVVTGIPAAVCGALLFTQVASPRHLARIIGAALLGFVALRASGRLRFDRPAAATRLLAIGGAVTGLLSGFVGSSGPISAAIFLALGLPPVAYIATDATASLLVHLAKSVVYARQLPRGDAFLVAATVLSAGMILGSILGKHVASRVPRATFERAVTVLLVLAALQLIIAGDQSRAPDVMSF